MEQKLFLIGVVLMCSLLSVNSLCNFPCSVQTGGDYDGELGSFRWSCDNSSRLIRTQGSYTEIQECFARNGPFTVLRRNGNQYQCVKEAAVTGKVTWVYETEFLTMWNPPTVCSICTPVLMRPMMYVDPSVICIPGTKKKGQYTLKSLKKMKPPPIGCNRPKNCPLSSTLDVPCTGCEPFDDGSCCPGCKRKLQQSYAYAYAYADIMMRRQTEEVTIEAIVGKVKRKVRLINDNMRTKSGIVDTKEMVLTVEEFQIEMTTTSKSILSDNEFCFTTQYRSILCGTPAFIFGVIGCILAVTCLVVWCCCYRQKRKRKRRKLNLNLKLQQSKLPVTNAADLTSEGYMDIEYMCPERYQRDPLQMNSKTVTKSPELYTYVGTEFQKQYESLKPVSNYNSDKAKGAEEKEYAYADSKELRKMISSQHSDCYENYGFRSSIQHLSEKGRQREKTSFSQTVPSDQQSMEKNNDKDVYFNAQAKLETSEKSKRTKKKMAKYASSNDIEKSVYEIIEETKQALCSTIASNSSTSSSESHYVSASNPSINSSDSHFVSTWSLEYRNSFDFDNDYENCKDLAKLTESAHTKGNHMTMINERPCVDGISLSPGSLSEQIGKDDLTGSKKIQINFTVQTAQNVVFRSNT